MSDDKLPDGWTREEHDRYTKDRWVIRITRSGDVRVQEGGWCIDAPVAVLRALLGVPDVRAEIAAAMRRILDSGAPAAPQFETLYNDLVTPGPLPAGTPDVAGGAREKVRRIEDNWPHYLRWLDAEKGADVAGALAELREAYDADRGIMDVGECLDVFEGAIKRAIELLEGKGT